ncbi:MAG: ubiquinol-cytochrome c reductase iron-sulfur subunit [Alphaproteobacteria bacterium]|nr:ubiquinol-cytochrome c reductase iron-sulfur subunit [Alphaproteobacteria bacterium]
MTIQPSANLDVGDRAPRRLSRRNLLYTSTALFGAVGLAAAAWPFIDQMNPDATARAHRDVVGFDLAGLEAGQQRVARWRNRPIVVRRRGEATLAWLRDHPAGLRPADPARSPGSRQPPYANNWHRSADPAYGVFVAVCSWCACAPLQDEPDLPGGMICPCCASRYDAAGRPAQGPAQLDLLVPPHAREGSQIMIGQRKPGERLPDALIDRS